MKKILEDIFNSPTFKNLDLLRTGEEWYTEVEKTEMDRLAKKGLEPIFVIDADAEPSMFLKGYRTSLTRVKMEDNELYVYKVFGERHENKFRYILFAKPRVKEFIRNENYKEFKSIATRYDKVLMGNYVKIYSIYSKGAKLIFDKDEYLNNVRKHVSRRSRDYDKLDKSFEQNEYALSCDR